MKKSIVVSFIVNGKLPAFFTETRFFEIIVQVEKLSQLFTLCKLRRFPYERNSNCN